MSIHDFTLRTRAVAQAKERHPLDSPLMLANHVEWHNNLLVSEQEVASICAPVDAGIGRDIAAAQQRLGHVRQPHAQGVHDVWISETVSLSREHGISLSYAMDEASQYLFFMSVHITEDTHACALGLLDAIQGHGVCPRRYRCIPNHNLIPARHSYISVRSTISDVETDDSAFSWIDPCENKRHNIFKAQCETMLFGSLRHDFTRLLKTYADRLGIMQLFDGSIEAEIVLGLIIAETQADANVFVEMWNAVRHGTGLRYPSGIPQDIIANPENFSTADLGLAFNPAKISGFLPQINWRIPTPNMLLSRAQRLAYDWSATHNHTWPMANPPPPPQGRQ
ncbi:hypothetical protein SISSUDRAFT_1037753 [Sistotremastrum suecicum HHB10207 ss-3]|uniref:Uncharacterized protein n=1 Tax=Sistotremastrum suecicum HHB10207 ss-3 TaxID=1314776 RepID=A0A165XQ20_9AGAM|nr:hypothetical protein SISSUDRAFT_1037753 [Sistotremastrum suecicum HHB10207 ss-3]